MLTSYNASKELQSTQLPLKPLINNQYNLNILEIYSYDRSYTSVEWIIETWEKEVTPEVTFIPDIMR